MIERSKPLNRGGPAQRHIGTERRRLRDGPRPDEAAIGLDIDNFTATTDGAPSELIERIKEVLTSVNARSAPGLWPSEAEWPELLPDWFVHACGPEMTPDEEAREIERWRALSYEEQVARDRKTPWRLSVWLSYMEPDDRWWIWWYADAADDRTAIIGIDRIGDIYPALPGEFAWMLRACGATEVDSFAEGRFEIPYPS